MEPTLIVLIAGLIFLAAVLYASVGHGGASGYLAVMALFGLAPEEMKPAALVLNIIVSSIALTRYARGGFFSWSLFWPFALASVPFAYLGGLLSLPALYYKPLIGLVLVYAAWHFMRDATRPPYAVRTPRRAGVLGLGATLGLLSGLTGVGGGIFLSPVLILLRWAPVRQVSGVAAAFILVNSIAGLAGFLSAHAARLPEGLPWWALMAACGGVLGAEFGSKRFGHPAIKRALALVLLVAGVKMVLTAGA